MSTVDGGSVLGPLQGGAQPTAATPSTATTPLQQAQQVAQSGANVSQTGPGAGAASVAGQAAVKASAPKRPARRGGKAAFDRPVRALFILTLKNPVRKMCIDVVEWKYPLNIYNLVILFIHFFCRPL